MMSGTFISSLSQILLKKSSMKTYPSKIYEYLNPYVIGGYAIFFLSTILGLIALKVLPLSYGPIIESSGHIFVPLFSYIFLKEKINSKQLLGIIIIIIGIITYAL